MHLWPSTVPSAVNGQPSITASDEDLRAAVQDSHTSPEVFAVIEHPKDVDNARRTGRGEHRGKDGRRCSREPRPLVGYPAARMEYPTRNQFPRFSCTADPKSCLISMDGQVIPLDECSTLHVLQGELKIENPL